MNATVEILTRQMLVVRRLSRNMRPVEADVLLDFLEQECELRFFRYPTERKSRMRLLQRDIKDIDEMFHIEIERCGRSAYCIKRMDENAIISYDRFFANFDVLTSVNPNSVISKYVLPERNRYVGSMNLNPLLAAIKGNIVVEFDYTNFRNNDSVSHHMVSPLFLKEDQQRWYLIGQTERGVRIYGLDRISGLRFTDEVFKRDESVVPEEMFKDSFGIWYDPNIPVEEVELRYDALDGKFLKTVPLHQSQTILADNDEEFRIKVKLRITNDFVMELLSRSRSLEVISPEHLRRRVYEVMRVGAERNKIAESE